MYTMNVSGCMQTLVQCGANLAGVGYSPDQGLLWHEALAQEVAAALVHNNATKYDVWLMAAFIRTYCDHMVLMRYCYECELLDHRMQYNFEDGPDEFLVKDHPAHNMGVIIDIEKTIAAGQRLGWKKGWNPWGGTYGALWDEAMPV